MPDESEDAGLELQKQSSADAETAEAGYRKTAKRILCLVLAIPVSAAGVWLLQQGAGYQGGSLLIGLGIQAAAGIVFVGALVLVAIGLLGMPSGAGTKGVDPLEEEAERRGLPTDPAAYQDGGVGVAATTRTTAQAELIAGALNAEGVPAWIDQANIARTLSLDALLPQGVRVLVPLGRLADAQAIQAKRAQNVQKAKALVNRAAARATQEECDAVIRDCTKAIELDPGNTRAYVYRGCAYVMRGGWHEAIADFAMVIDLNPESAWGYRSRGRTYIRTGEHAKAIRDLTKAIELRPEDDRAERATDHCVRGVALANQSDWNAAIRDYTKAIELDPNLAMAYCNRGDARNELGDYDAAITDSTKAIELDPNLAEAYLNRACAYAKVGEHDAAIEDLAKSIELNPADPEAYSSRAAEHFHRSDYDKAWADVKECQRLGGEVDPKFLAELRKASGREE